MNEAIRIVLADDHPVVLIGVRALLQVQGARFQIVGQAQGGDELLVLLREQACDLLITDFSMPDEQGGQDGLPLLRRIRRDHPEVSVIVLTMVHNPAMVAGMLALGVHGVVDKSSLTSELITAIGSVISRRGYVSSTLRPLVRKSMGGRGDGGFGREGPTLSAREAEVVRMFVQGRTVTQIAEQLHRSVKTISQQKNDAMRKLGIETHSQLYEYATRNGLVS